MSTKAAERAQQMRRVREAEAERKAHRRRWLRLAAWVLALAVVGGVVIAMMLASRSETSSATRVAPSFSLTDTAGRTVALSDYRGTNVVLYFSEGAGCQACLVEMREIEQNAQAFADAHVTVLPIVMNSREEIMAEMAANGVTTPFLLDDGTVSKAYGVLGKGMHAGLPGHSFVIIDKAGRQRFRGEYPSMWLAPKDLLAQIDKTLGQH